ncbi:MAG TPA: AglZ/HisF2 family acetamidino modification protein [Ignavibacteria bacterium]
MVSPRIIPVLLLKGEGLVKGIKFKNHRYLGDPINAVKIFNDKEVDELIFLDINANKEGRTISPELVDKLSTECYMPFSIGGGIRNIEQIKMLLGLGAEKVIINTEAVNNPNIIKEASEIFGSQSVVISVDVKKSIFGIYNVFTYSGIRKEEIKLTEYLKKIEEYGAGEIMINSIDKDGTMTGYDIDLIKIVKSILKIPLIASGGAGEFKHFKEAFLEAKVSAVAAGSMFVFIGKKRGILINYPDKDELKNIF